MSCLVGNKQREEIPGRSVRNAQGVSREVGHSFVLAGI